jgi:Fe-coproporphyrin III synthase
METLVSIANIAESTNVAAHRVHALPVLVIFPHNQCNCRCVMCDIWRNRETQQLTPADVEKQLSSIRKLGVRWVVFSGGEPQLNEKWSCLAQMLRAAGSRVTLLTAELLLNAQARRVVDVVDDVIVSLDGPPALHNSIRRVKNAFEQLKDGVTALRLLRPEIPIRARCTVQRANHRALRAVVRTAKDLALTSVSFLAADVTSGAFNRAEPWPANRVDQVALSAEDVAALETEIEELVDEHQSDIDSGFLVESAFKLRRIVQHFRAQLRQSGYVAPRCNAPWVSAVIEASGDVRPCFFHPAVGNIHRVSLPEIINGPAALSFRANLDVASNPVCQRCVCSLHIPREDS